jgi:hypothetical protein
MNVELLIIADLSRRGIRLTPDGDGLIVEPASQLTDKDCDLIQQHKAEILTALAYPQRNRWPVVNRPPMPLRRCGSRLPNVPRP